MSNIENTAKAPYAQPKLSVYGGFTQLTAGGSGANIEINVGGMNAMRNPRV